jgi:predicted MFS family arabinose efflux permease
MSSIYTILEMGVRSPTLSTMGYRLVCPPNCPRASVLTSSIVCVGNVLVTNLVASDEQSVGGALFQTSYTVGFALGNNLSSLVIQRLGNDSGKLLHGLRGASGLNTACAWISKSDYLGGRK